MKIAVVEDEEAHGRLLEKYILDWAGRRGVPVRVQICDNAEIFLFCCEDISFDAVFADIQMPGMNGMDMIRKLREKGNRVPVIFATGIADYMQEGYEVEALHYLLKPLSAEKVSACLDKALERHRAVEFVTVDTEDGVRKLEIGAINYCEATGHKTEIVLAGGERVYSSNSLSELSGMLLGKGLIKCHRSYLCNVPNINRIVSDTLIFDDGARIPVSRRLYREVNRAFIDRFSKG